MSGPKISNPVYRIETKRLVLRCWNPSDAALFMDAITVSKDHLLPFMPWAANIPEPFDTYVERLRSFRARFDGGEDYVYGVFNGDESRVLGGTGLHTRLKDDALEIGYWIHKDFINQGFATELSAALTKVAFEIYHINRMEIHCSIKNQASAAVPRKLGYTHEATRRRLSFAYGEDTDSMSWTLFADEYPNTPSAKAEIKAFDVIGRKML